MTTLRAKYLRVFVINYRFNNYNGILSPYPGLKRMYHMRNMKSRYKPECNFKYTHKRTKFHERRYTETRWFK